MSSVPNNPNSKNPLRGAVEIIPDRLYYCALKSPPTSHKLLLRNRKNEKVPVRCFNIDEDLVYWNFFLDFGPLNLGQLYRFTVLLNSLLQDPKTTILFYSSTHPAKRTNAIYLISAWQVLELQRTPEQAFYGFQNYYNDSDPGGTSTQSSPNKKNCSLPPPAPLTSVGQATVAPLPPFHDASPVACTYELTLEQCLQGLIKAKQFNFFDWDSFNVEEYEYFEQVENGDLNWIVQGKILAFAGPSFKKNVSPEGYCTLAPSDYIPYFQSKKVSLVVRLNKRNYEEQEFVKAGINHLEQFYVDGSCPPMSILQRVLRSFESVPKGEAFAIHCKAGLGRTGTCIGAYLMKHYRMSAPEVIAWMRICRPGCVIGPQQQFLQDLEPIMWQEGEMMRLPSTPSSNTEDQKKSRSNSKKESSRSKSSKSKKSSTYPTRGVVESTVTEEATTGRPGQADGLLARRQRGSAPMTTTPKRDKAAPAPVTPDSTSSTTKTKGSTWIETTSS